jgi:CRISPR/Cas system CSM-associated protein Csm3 (group 7 of RAMP superfamily)
MTPTNARLLIAFHDFWHCGTGSGSGAESDAVVVRDRLGLPMVPGRTIKGMFRTALETLEYLGQITPGTVEVLLGSRGAPMSTRTDMPSEAVLPVRGTRPGRLAFDDGLLNAQLRAAFAAGELASDEAALRNTLFVKTATTAIDAVTGIAANRTLRVIEVAVPLEMEAHVSLLPNKGFGHAFGSILPEADYEQAIVDRWLDTLSDAASLIGTLGAQRTRGFGRCQLIFRAA